MKGIAELRHKYYHSWGFMRSPASQQIKCELRILCQFSFTLGIDSEIDTGDVSGLASRLLGLKAVLERRKSLKGRISSGPSKKSTTNGGALQQPLKDGVRDILVSHHLFSWDL